MGTSRSALSSGSSTQGTQGLKARGAGPVGSRRVGARGWVGTAAVTVALCGGGCKGAPGPGLKIQAAEPARDHSCLRGPGKTSYPLVPLQDAGTLRVTVLRNTGAQPELVCDTTANWPDDRPNIDLGTDVGREQLSFFVELFAKNGGKRTWSGMLPGSASATADGAAGVMPMFSVGDFNCPTTTMSTGRAFHTATVLPNGEVLIFGGVEPLRAYGPDWFGVLSSAEVYDPVRLSFTDVTLPKDRTLQPKPRAFHHVAVLSATAEQVKLLAFGGLSANLPGLPALTTPDRASQFRLMPASYGIAGGAEILIYDVASHALSVQQMPDDMTRAAFAGGAALAGATGGPDAGLLVTGGTDFFPTKQNIKTPLPWTYVRSLSWFTPSADAVQKANVALPFDLLQPSVTPLSAGTALILGAKLPTTMAEPLQMYAAAVTGLPGQAQLATPQAIQGSPTIGHTATRLADAGGKARVLLTGGFLMTSQPPPAPPQPPDPGSTVRLYTVDDPAGTAATVALTSVPALGSPACGDSSDRYRPAAYEAAAATWSGQRVLITGGSPRFNSGVCNDCQPQDGVEDNPQCVLNQAHLYDAETNQLRRLTPLMLPRFGHVQTLLRDGNILLTGGLVRSSGQNIDTTAAVSLFNSRSADPGAADPDDPVNAALSAEQQNQRRGQGLIKPCARVK